MPIGEIKLLDPEKTTEKTAPQLINNLSNDSRITRPYSRVSYSCIRRLRKDPTVQLARWAVVSPIIHTPWVYELQGKKGSREMIEALENELSPLRDFFLQQATFGTLDYGWQPFEVVYVPIEGRIEFTNFKALIQDYTEILVYVDSGQFAGFLNTPTGSAVTDEKQIEIDYALCTNFSVEGTDWYGMSVFESLDGITKSYEEVEKAANRYDKKIAGACWVVYYPVGVSTYNGTETANDQIAKDILTRLEASGGAVIPDEIQEWADDAIDSDIKGKWRIELISADSSSQKGFIDRQKYLDALKMRAFGLTERSLLEGSHGTKAEADVHADVSLGIVHTRHKLLCNQLTTGPVSTWLKWNYGDKYKNSVVVKPAPLVDAQFSTVKEIYRLIMQTPETLSEEIQKLDLASIRTQLGIPSTTTPQLVITKPELDPMTVGENNNA